MPLPSLPRGRPTKTKLVAHQEAVTGFCNRIKEIASGLDFRVSSRGWAYILENDGVITKGEIDAAQRLVNECRKSGDLPLEICAVDEKRSADGLDEYIDRTSVEEEAEEIYERASAVLESGHEDYRPFSFWDTVDTYIEIAVEKIDLKSLFAPVAAYYHVPIVNIGGWCDINGRAAMMRRFADRERRGQRCVLLYCGDHDPGGLRISDCIRNNFADLTGAVGWNPENLIIDRFGLNADFIEANGLVWIDNLETGSGGDLADRRHRDHKKFYVQDYLRKFGARKVEANALVVRPSEGRMFCQEAILRYLPDGARGRYKARLEEVREEVRLAVENLMGGR
jgi:hypothetical protein